MRLKKTVIIGGFLFIFSVLPLMFVNINHDSGAKNSFISNLDTLNPIQEPKIALDEPNGRSLLVHQHANITKTYLDVSSGENVSFTLVQDWTSKNVTINYDGVSQKKDWVTNGDFLNNKSGWSYEEVDTGGHLSDGVWVGWDGNPTGSLQIGVVQGNYYEGDIAYYYQNIAIPEELASKISTLSLDYNYQDDPDFPENGSIYMAIIIDGVEKNKTIDINDVTVDQWNTIKMQYNPVSYGQTLPGNVTVRVGISIDDDCSKLPAGSTLALDNVKLEFWTIPNNTGIIRAYDVEQSQDYTYYNTSSGVGYSFIDFERIRSPTDHVIFTIYENISESIVDFSIDTITLHSPAVKVFNSTISGNDGSFYALGEYITWCFDFSIFTPSDYVSWVTIEKPSDFSLTSILDGFDVEQVGNCLGTGAGSTLLLIPNSILGEGIWKCEANSENYITSSNTAVWGGTQFENNSSMTFGDVFMINVTLNDTITFTNTNINLSICYPNGTLFLNISREPTSYNEKFGNFTVGKNMSVGEYRVFVEWTNNISSNYRDKVGYAELTFIVWHYTNLTAVDSYIEKISGDPCLVKVKFLDFNFNSTISFATVTYNTTFGQSGNMVYLGAGIYFLDLDTAALGLGDYYFSFNATKSYYENQTEIALVHLKIVAQPLKLEVPKTTINAIGNSYAVCQVNVTGALLGTLLWPANVSTDWQKDYTVTDHLNGTHTLNFSTEDLPTSGLLENFVITIYANKTNYGSTTDFITITINPVSANGSVNETIINAYLNKDFDVKANFTDEGLGTLISGATCSVSWAGSSTVTPFSDEFIINLNTFGLDLDVHNALIKLEKAGYETIYLSVTVIVQSQEVNLTVNINSVQISENTLINLYFKESINVSARVFALGEQVYLSGGACKWVSNYYQENLTESPTTYYNSSIIMDAANFSAGINYVYLQFEKVNYSTKTFSFQLFIRAQSINITLKIDSVKVSENILIEKSFNDVFDISCRAYADAEKVFLSGGTFKFISSLYELNLTEYGNFWYNKTVSISTSIFSIGIKYVYVMFEMSNYTTTTFSFQIQVSQIKLNLSTIGFVDAYDAKVGQELGIKINLTDFSTNALITGAKITYSWAYGVGSMVELGGGIYQLNLTLPQGVIGSFKITLVIVKEGGVYETTQASFLVSITAEETPPYLFWTIIIILIGAMAVLGVYILRANVLIPRARKKESELLAKTQRFKDMANLQAFMIIHRKTSLPLFSKAYSFLEDSPPQLFSGFVQTITTMGQQLAARDSEKIKKKVADDKSKDLMEIDFKYFQTIIYDYESIRMIFILKKKASDEMKEDLKVLTKKYHAELKEILDNFKGILIPIKEKTPELLNKLYTFHYKEPFKLTDDMKLYNKMKNSSDLSSLELRILNVIVHEMKKQKEFMLTDIPTMVSEDNKDLVIEAIEMLITLKLLVPTKWIS